MADHPAKRTTASVLPDPAEERVNLADAARFLGISHRTVQRLLERGELKGTKVGRQWRFRKADLVAYLEREPAAVATPPEEDIRQALESLQGWVEEVTLTIAPSGAGATEPEGLLPEALLPMASRTIQQAIRHGASAIHVEPGPTGIQICFRVDGVLHEVGRWPLSLHAGLIARFKQMAGMKVGEHRLAQDGSFLATWEEKAYEVRASCLPTLRGEKLVMRILDRDSVLIEADQLGFLPDTLAQLDEVIARPRGLFFVTGPTGAGKTTTLYALLHRLSSPARNISTVEDPVEYELPGITQIPVNAPLGLTFPALLRALIRQDPDVLMVAQIRDMETLQTAFDAAGASLVLAVMHTEDAASAVTRLLDLRLGSFTVATAFLGALAQRLARRLCPVCKEPGELSLALRDEVQRRSMAGGLVLPGDAVFYRAVGCRQCHQTGYHGRIGLFELLQAGPALKDAIFRQAPTEELRAIAVQHGLRPLAIDGILKALQGLTTVEEVLRVI